MEAKELMIGDWVYDKYSFPEKWQPRQWKICAFEGDFIELANPETSCKPIPLTAEILEKNGWERDVDKEWKYNNSHILPRHCYQWERRNVKIEMDKGLEGFTTSLIIGRRFYYVNELQHALRLCGLTELADKFRIE